MQKVEISYKTIIFTVLFLISLQILWIVRELIYALALAFIIMSALKPIVSYLQKHKIPRTLAAILVMITTFSLTIFIFAFIFPPLVNETFVFIKNFPHLIKTVVPNLSAVINFDSITSFIPELTQNAFGIIGGLFSNYVFVISVFFFAFYFLLEEKFIQKILIQFLSEKETSKICLIFSKVEARMAGWVWGQLTLMLVMGILTYIGLSIVGLKYALSLAVIAGLLEVIPFIGPITSSIPAFIVAASSSTFLGLSILILYFVLHELENNLVVPIVMQKAVGLSPIIILIALSVGGRLAGILGIILSVPLVLVIITVFTQLRHKN